MYLSLAQNDSLRGTGRRAWRYTPRCGQNDTSVTGWCVMALKSAQLSGLDVSQSAYDGAKQFITDMTDSTGKVGYLKPGEDNTVASGINEDWACHRAMTAVGLLSRIFIDKKKGDPAMGQAVKHLMSDLPRWDPSLKTEKPADFYYWYYGTYALNQYEGATNGANWTRWNKVVGDILCTTQCTKKDGCANGSWPAEHDRWAHYGGRVYGTAMNVLTLEVYYRMVNVFGGEKRSDK